MLAAAAKEVCRQAGGRMPRGTAATAMPATSTRSQSQAEQQPAGRDRPLLLVVEAVA